MRYTLHITSAADDRHTVYSFVISNVEGIKSSGVFIATGKRHEDLSYCGHVALQRALREVSKLEGVIQLHVNFDVPLYDLVLEIMELEEPSYPQLAQTTALILRRFDNWDIGAGEYSNFDSDIFEAAALDNALEALEDARTFKGRLLLLRDRFINTRKIIR